MRPAKTGHQHPTVTFRRELIRANLRIQSGQPRLPIGAAKRIPASREHSMEVGKFQDVSRKNTLPHLNLTSWVSEFSFRELALVTRGWRFAGTVGTLSSLPWLKRCFILSQCKKPLIQLLPRSVSWASWACMDGFAGGVAVSSCRSCKHDHPSSPGLCTATSQCWPCRCFGHQHREREVALWDSAPCQLHRKQAFPPAHSAPRVEASRGGPDTRGLQALRASY